MDTGKNADLPLGLGMALMRNTDAFLYFSALNSAQRSKIIKESRKVHSRKEMKSFVDKLTPSD